MSSLHSINSSRRRIRRCHRAKPFLSKNEPITIMMAVSIVSFIIMTIAVINWSTTTTTTKSTALSNSFVITSVDAFVPEIRGSARLFLDTGDPKEWEDLLPTGIFEGVTCNPTLLERAHQKCTIENLHSLSATALNLGADEIMVQAWGGTSNELYDCGMKLSEPDRERIVIKVPIVSAGVEAAARLVRSNVRVCLTASYHHKQALIAANVGAEYIAPYLGRMNDAGDRDGVEECIKMQQIIEGVGAETRVLVASIRDCQTMVDLAAEGMETFTISPQVARELFVEPLTKEAAKAFEEAAIRNS